MVAQWNRKKYAKDYGEDTMPIMLEEGVKTPPYPFAEGDPGCACDWAPVNDGDGEPKLIPSVWKSAFMSNEPSLSIDMSVVDEIPPDPTSCMSDAMSRLMSPRL